MKYNLAIIGGGPAGYTAAEKAAKAGMSVVLFEKEALGGTCLNIGCIPTKTLLYSAKLYHNAVNSQKYGITASGVEFDFSKMQQRKQKVVRKLVAGIKQKLKDITVISGSAKVESYSEDTIVISCNDEQYEAEKLLICTGSHNFVPPIEGINQSTAVIDSTQALELTQLPKSIAIIGGGVIGMEFATLFMELGVEVTVIEAMPDILPNLDHDCVSILLEKYKKQGIKFFLSHKVRSISDNKITCEDPNGESIVLEAEKILVSVGRRANLDGLEKLVGLEFERNGIKVNETMQTNLKNVYAAGDVTGKIMLAHVASRQAEVAVARMLKQIPVQRIAYNAIPSVVYTNPEIASVGLREDELKGGNDIVLPIEYTVKTLPMAFSGRFVAENEAGNGLCKVIIDNKHQTILGVHCIGNPASEFIAAASFAVRMGYTLPEFQQVVFPHPTVSEILRETIES